MVAGGFLEDACVPLDDASALVKLAGVFLESRAHSSRRIIVDA
jgi:hypothetical protein